MSIFGKKDDGAASKIVLMLDFETLDISPNSVVLQAGVAAVDLHNSTFTPIPSIRLEENLNLNEQIHKGRTINADTLCWHLTNKSSQALFDQDVAISVEAFLEKFTNIITPETNGGYTIDEFWSKGVDFDLAMLENLFKQYNRKYPVHYRKKRCYRTLEALVDGKLSKVQFNGAKHVAYMDAIHQLKQLHAWAWQLSTDYSCPVQLFGSQLPEF
jgi:hypothetical protein